MKEIFGEGTLIDFCSSIGFAHKIMTFIVAVNYKENFTFGKGVIDTLSSANG